MIKAYLLKFFVDWLNSHKISLALVVAIWILLSPTYDNLIQFQTKTEAKFDYYDEFLREERKFKKELSDKMNLLMIETGISKSKIEAIEKQNYNK